MLLEGERKSSKYLLIEDDMTEKIEGENQSCLAEDTNKGDTLMKKVFERETGLGFEQAGDGVAGSKATNKKTLKDQ